jgi:hypothetical protein
MRLVLFVSLLAFPALAAPSWANKSDSADEKGTVFICSGEGKSEQDALDAALGICNDKICKLCGVEVESTVTTSETLKGVDLQRKVVERCHRVRKAEPQLRGKSLECEEGRCQAFIQLFYSKETQKAECSAYAQEDFADPAKCEQDIEAFRQQQGFTAASMRQRDGQLGAALSHCAQIDVRPTPALLALDEKLRVGLGNLSSSGERNEAGEFLGTYGPTMQAIAENKTLLGRISLARGLVASKVLVLDVVEASLAEDLDSPAGVARLLASYRAAPLGSSYGAPDPHFLRLGSIAGLKADTRPVAEFLRTAYQPEKPPPDLNQEDWSLISRMLAADRQVTAAEWEWGLRVTRAKLCSRCLAPLLAAPDHGEVSTRLARFFEGIKELRAAFGNNRRKEYGIYELLPHDDPVFVLQAESAAPPELKPFFDFETYGHVVGVFRSTQSLQEQEPARRRWAEKAALPGRDGDLCRELSRRLEALQREAAPRVPALDQTVCTCLDGPFAAEERSQKKVVLQYALDGRLACVEAP